MLVRTGEYTTSCFSRLQHFSSAMGFARRAMLPVIIQSKIVIFRLMSRQVGFTKPAIWLYILSLFDNTAKNLFSRRAMLPVIIQSKIVIFRLMSRQVGFTKPAIWLYILSLFDNTAKNLFLRRGFLNFTICDNISQ